MVGCKFLMVNQPYFVGRPPALPVMPVVLVVEAMAQAGGVVLLIELRDHGAGLLLFTGIERARSHRPVSPGDRYALRSMCWSGAVTPGACWAGRASATK